MHVRQVHFTVGVDVHAQHGPAEQQIAQLEILYYVVHVLHVQPRLIEKLAAEINGLLDYLEISVVDYSVAVHVRIQDILHGKAERVDRPDKSDVIFIHVSVVIDILVKIYPFGDRRQVALIHSSVRRGKRLSFVIDAVRIQVVITCQVRPFYVLEADLHGSEFYYVLHADDIVLVKLAVLVQVGEIGHSVA